MSPRAFARWEDHDERGYRSVLYGEDEAGAVALDDSPNEDEWDVEVEHLNTHPDELAESIAHARAGTGPWARSER